MPSIRIIGIPPGEAPENIRQAWVGLSLPLSKGHGIKPKNYLGGGALSGPKDLRSTLFALFFNGYQTSHGYAVDTLTAVEILANENPEAAKWWHSFARYLMKPKQRLIFPSSVCEVEV